MRRFEKITNYQWDTSLPMPSRKTEFSAGYDMVAAEDMIIPSYWDLMEKLRSNDPHMPLTLDNMGSLTKAIKAKPTLVPTGMKCYLNENEYLELSVRSSFRLNTGLSLLMARVLLTEITLITRTMRDIYFFSSLIYLHLIL